MKTRIRTAAVVALLVLAGSLSLASQPAVSAARTTLSPSAYNVSALCSTPSPNHAGCLGLRLVAKSPSSVPHARALLSARPGSSSSPSAAFEFKEPIKGSLTPGNLLTAYNLLGTPPPASTQTIGIVDAYDDATAAADLERYGSRFGLPACTEKGGCFRKVNQEGTVAPLPPSEGIVERGWAQEIATDVEIAHAVCKSCHILLVEANSTSYSDLTAAEATAGALGASVISNSWGGEEPSVDSPAFNHPGVVITASSGDNGYLNWFEEPESRFVEYPASSPHVVAVGGTRLKLTSPGETWESETVWNDGGESEGFKNGAGAGGSGCSALFTAPPWQQSVSDWATVGCGNSRSVADVSADADPYTGVAVYDSTENPEGNKGWGVIGGTSVASPIIAAAFALAGGAQGVEYPARTLYENEVRAPASLHDVVSGSNGECSKPFNGETGTSGCSIAEEAKGCSATAICLAGGGYDGPSGVGTPNGIGAFQPPPAAKRGAETTGGETPVGGATGRGGGGGEATVGGGVTGAPNGNAPGTTTSSAIPRAILPPRLSALSLTRRAIVALDRVRPELPQVGFTFTLSAATRIRVALARRVRARGRMQWKGVSRPFTIFATAGRRSQHLSGRGVLALGRYRLTLTPAGGTAASIVFQIG